MSSRRSDNLPGTADAPAAAPDAPGGFPAPAGPGGPGTAVAAPAGSASLTASPSGWAPSLLANLPVPLLLLALVGVGWVVEQSGFIDRYFQRIITLVGFNIILAVG